MKLSFQHTDDNRIIVRDADTGELCYQVKLEDFLLWIELMDLEEKGYIGIYAKRKATTIAMTLPNIT